jgi:hypothetical protein
MFDKKKKKSSSGKAIFKAYKRSTMAAYIYMYILRSSYSENGYHDLLPHLIKKTVVRIENIYAQKNKLFSIPCCIHPIRTNLLLITRCNVEQRVLSGWKID